MKKSNHPTEYRKGLKSRILLVAMQEFMHRGIRTVKMDDIAHTLGISKRTLYEIYPNKESLLLEGIKLRHAMAEEEMTAFVAEQQRNTMEIILKFYHMQMEELSLMPAAFLADIRSYPTVTEFLQRKHMRNEENVMQFFRQGVSEGYFRSDVDYQLVGKLGEGMMQGAIGRQLYEHYKPSYIFRNVIFLLLRGFCTQRGLEYIDQTLNQNP